ncbi:MAG: DUF4332 domain-containing protein [Gemmatimonadota bacterium]|nr:DUF4332 domain-containing protein [Gemmatimonadota bacterium]
MVRTKIEQIGIGARDAEKLRKAGVDNTENLIERGRTRQGRRELSRRARIRQDRLLRWVHTADLCRIHGIRPEIAALLAAAGVASSRELAVLDPDVLADLCAEVNEEKRFTPDNPTRLAVKHWVEQALRLQPQVEL